LGVKKPKKKKTCQVQGPIRRKGGISLPWGRGCGKKQEETHLTPLKATFDSPIARKKNVDHQKKSKRVHGGGGVRKRTKVTGNAYRSEKKTGAF